MEKRYTQLSLEERDRITEMKAAKSSITEIAEELGRAKSTISREVRRNSSPAYRLYLSHRAHERAAKRKKEANTRPRLKEDITEAIGTKCYFARPYASWQKSTNENINRLIRWYLPKGTDFSKIMDEEVAHIESLLNNRPRKCLGYKTPLEVASSFVALQG